MHELHHLLPKLTQQQQQQQQGKLASISQRHLVSGRRRGSFILGSLGQREMISKLCFKIFYGLPHRNFFQQKSGGPWSIKPQPRGVYSVHCLLCKFRHNAKIQIPLIHYIEPKSLERCTKDNKFVNYK